MVRLLLLAIMSALVAAACSGSSGPAPEATTAAAKPGEAAYVASVCSAFEVGSNAASVGDNGIAGAERYVQLLKQVSAPTELAVAHGQRIAALTLDLTQLRRNEVARLGVWELKRKPGCTSRQSEERPPVTWCYDSDLARSVARGEAVATSDAERSRTIGDAAIRPVRAFPPFTVPVQARLRPLIKADASCRLAGVTDP